MVFPSDSEEQASNSLSLSNLAILEWRHAIVHCICEPPEFQSNYKITRPVQFFNSHFYEQVRNLNIVDTRREAIKTTSYELDECKLMYYDHT